MKTTILILFMAFCNFVLLAQNWSEPINITNNGHSGNPDFTVTSDGTIHVVYFNWIIDENQSRWIEYKNSTDGGLTWSEPDTVVYGSYEIWLPSIASNQNDEIIVAFDYNYKIVGRKIINGHLSEVDTISKNVPHSHNCKLYTDNKERIYCFWYYGQSSTNTFYSVYENGEWGHIVIPYNFDVDSVHYFDIHSVAAEENGTLHFVGFLGYNGISDLNLFYTKGAENNWGVMNFFRNHVGLHGIDIKLDRNNTPSIAYGKKPLDVYKPDSVFYRYKDDEEWIEELVDVQNQSAIRLSQLVIDGNNRPNIFYTQYELDGMHYLLMGYKHNGVWSKDTVASKPTYYNPCFMKVEDEIYGIYQCEAYNLQFVKTDFVQAIEDQENNATLNLICFPNPFSNNLKINYKLINKQPGLKLTVYNAQGVKVQEITNLGSTPGNHSLTLRTGGNMKSGVYFIQLKGEKFTMTQKVIKSRYY